MAAKFGLTIFVVLFATQVFSSSASCIYPPPPCPSSSYGSPSYSPSGYSPSGYSQSSYSPSVYSPPVYSPPPSYYSPPECAVPPVYLPTPSFPKLPTIHAPHPMTIPLKMPYTIPVGRVCVCKNIQIKPTIEAPCLCPCKPCVPVTTCL